MGGLPVTVGPDEAHRAYEALVAAVGVRRKAVILMAKALKVLASGWKVLGYSSFAELLAQPEVQLREKTARQYIRLYEVLVEEYGIPEDELLGVSSDRLQVLRTLPKEKAAGLVDAAKALGYLDFEKEVQEAKQKDDGCRKVCRWYSEGTGKCLKYKEV